MMATNPADLFPTLERRAAALDADGQPKRIVAIADVHGMASHLDHLVAGVNGIDAFADAAFFILGDLVDRGPDSRGAIDRALALAKGRAGSRIFLGNHDEWFLRFLIDELAASELSNWIEQGGRETLASYQAGTDRSPQGVREAILKDCPSHLECLRRADTIALVGDLAFVHAGVDPTKPLDNQSARDCVWIRAPFMRHAGPLSHIVVHGHTPQKDNRPTLTENRISIDTGACYGGLLTAALIDREAKTLDFLSTDGVNLVIREPVLTDRGFGTVRKAYRPGGALVFRNEA
ncbi:metallophosphoesterase [Fulvimarina sp. 2208YS6-2-32]|uniref:Metallophosphoesterase n=1 Tax=Fulvimarina uroteuthidis TaxID=3098149 RepID=A0ABU5HWN3_9HYPH|nr:metallophosphoesterase [Fulvimarina sp. 2208YS6-2-32]MDY8107548.1 metallophosphoesterase [Fulvimarina sp. 2208YS6-2-32]